MSLRSSTKAPLVAAAAFSVLAFLSAGALLSTSSVASAAPTCLEQATAIKQEAMTTGIIDQTRLQSVYTCLQAQSGPTLTSPAASTPQTNAVQPSFLPGVLVGTYGANYGLVASCVQFYLDLTVTESTSAQIPVPTWGPFVQQATGFWLGWPSILSIFSLQGSSTSFGLTIGSFMLVWTPGDVISLLPMSAIDSCSSLIPAV